MPKPAERKSRSSRTPARPAKRPPRLRMLAVRHAIAVEREDFAKEGGTDASDRSPEPAGGRCGRPPKAS